MLFGHVLSYYPGSIRSGWNRDRFVLSAGHGSMFLYGWLHLSGYRDITLDEVKHFRKMHSKTPGHPELTHAPSGVESDDRPVGSRHWQRGRHGARGEDGRGALQHQRARHF